EKREELPCNRLYGRIDFEECCVMRGICIGSHRSRSQSENSEVLRFVARAHHLDDVTHRSAWVVVRKRLAGTGGFRAFNSVNRIAVEKLPQMRRGIIEDLLHAKEVPGCISAIRAFNIARQDECVRHDEYGEGPREP